MEKLDKKNEITIYARKRKNSELWDLEFHCFSECKGLEIAKDLMVPKKRVVFLSTLYPMIDKDTGNKLSL